MTEDDARKLGRAFAEGFIESLLGRRTAVAEPTRAAPASRWVRTSAFATMRGVAPSTVRAWVAAGMPAQALGRGYRVDVKAAEQWLRDGGASRHGRHDA